MLRARLGSALAALLLSAVSHVVSAQTVEVVPFGGYRFGGELFEVASATPLDIDGALCFGATLEVFVTEDTSVSFLFSRQETRVEFADWFGSSARRDTFSIDHWHLGGAQSLDDGPVRPFLTGSLGLTRFGNGHDSEIRFSMAGGGGVKLMPSRHLGARLDGRIYAVFVDGGIIGGVCGSGMCVIGVDVSVLWQAEFTAGLVLSF